MLTKGTVMASPPDSDWVSKAVDMAIGAAGGSGLTFLARVFTFGRAEGAREAETAARLASIDAALVRLRLDVDRIEQDAKAMASRADVARIETLLIELGRRIDDLLLKTRG